MRPRTILAAGLLLGVLGVPARAEEPEPTFTASTAGSPVPVAQGVWQESSASAARLRVVAAGLPSATTTFSATWVSPFAAPKVDRPAFEYAYSLNHARVTTGKNSLVFEYRYRSERGKWSRWAAHRFDLQHEAARSESAGGHVAVGIVATTGRSLPRLQWEWRVTGKLVGADALELEATVTSYGT